MAPPFLHGIIATITYTYLLLPENRSKTGQGLYENGIPVGGLILKQSGSSTERLVLVATYEE